MASQSPGQRHDGPDQKRQAQEGQRLRLCVGWTWRIPTRVDVEAR